MWRHINAYIVVSSHLTVTCVISHSVSRVLWRGISAYIVGSSHFLWCEISHSVDTLFWRRINPHIVGSSHFAMMCVIYNSAVTVIWRHVSSNTVMCVVNHTTVGIWPFDHAAYVFLPHWLQMQPLSSDMLTSQETAQSWCPWGDIVLLYVLYIYITHVTEWYIYTDSLSYDLNRVHCKLI
jgi:hypothetical protein